MEPIAQDGNFVFVRKYFPRELPRDGDIIAVFDPRKRSRIILKRIKKKFSDVAYKIEGDNTQNSTGSHRFGAISNRDIIGKMFL